MQQIFKNIVLKTVSAALMAILVTTPSANTWARQRNSRVEAKLTSSEPLIKGKTYAFIRPVEILDSNECKQFLSSLEDVNSSSVSLTVVSGTCAEPIQPKEVVKTVVNWGNLARNIGAVLLLPSFAILDLADFVDPSTKDQPYFSPLTDKHVKKIMQRQPKSNIWVGVIFRTAEASEKNILEAGSIQINSSVLWGQTLINYRSPNYPGAVWSESANIVSAEYGELKYSAGIFYDKLKGDTHAGNINYMESNAFRPYVLKKFCDTIRASLNHLSTSALSYVGRCADQSFGQDHVEEANNGVKRSEQHTAMDKEVLKNNFIINYEVSKIHGDALQK